MAATITDLSTERRGYRLNDTPARWQKALVRAIEEGVATRQLATTGVWVASSGSDGRTAYVVTPTECECRAGAEGDVCCKHRAALRHRLGLLDSDPDPEPPTPAAPAVLPAPSLDAEGWEGFWARLYAAYPGIAPGRIASMSDLSISLDPRSLPAVSGGDHSPDAASIECTACDGRGFHKKASKTFAGCFYRVGCLPCRGTGIR